MEKYTKIEVYKNSKQFIGTEKGLENIKLGINTPCDDKKLIKILAKTEKPKIDIVIERSNLFFRIAFKNKTETYLVYKNSGVLINISREREPFWLKDNAELNKFLKNLKL